MSTQQMNSTHNRLIRKDNTAESISHVLDLSSKAAEIDALDRAIFDLEQGWTAAALDVLGRLRVSL